MEQHRELEKRNLTVDEYCRAYSVGRTGAYRDMKAGELKFFMQGDRRLIPVEMAEDLRARRMAAAGIKIGGAR